MIVLICKYFTDFLWFWPFNDCGYDWLRIAVFVESCRYLIGISRLLVNFMDDFDTLDFLNTSQIVPSKSWYDLNLFHFNGNFHPFWDAVKFGGVALADDELNDIPTVEISFFAFQDRDEFYSDFFFLDQVDGRLDFF